MPPISICDYLFLIFLLFIIFLLHIGTAYIFYSLHFTHSYCFLSIIIHIHIQIIVLFLVTSIHIHITSIVCICIEIVGILIILIIDTTVLCVELSSIPVILPIHLPIPLIDIRWQHHKLPPCHIVPNPITHPNQINDLGTLLGHDHLHQAAAPHQRQHVHPILVVV